MPFAADVTKEETLAAAMEAARARSGRIDILHNNVGVSIGGGNKPLGELSEEAFDRVCSINLRGTIMACKPCVAIAAISSAEAISRSTARILAPSCEKRSVVARPLPIPSPGLNDHSDFAFETHGSTPCNR